MKRFLLITTALLSLFSLASCNKDDGSMDQDLFMLELRVTQLETQVQAAKSDIKALQILAKAQGAATKIDKVVPTDDGGFDISLSTGMTFHIASATNGTDGTDAHVLSIKKDEDGVWYWTLDGEWMLDAAGAKCPVNGTDAKDGITPQVRISADGWWEASMDNGANWTRISESRAFSVPVKVTEDDTTVTFTLPDESTIVLEKVSEFSFKVESTDVEVKEGTTTVTLKYTVSGADGKVGFKVLNTTGGYQAEFVTTKNAIDVTVPSPFQEGSVLVAAICGDKVLAQHIEFTQEALIIITDAAEVEAAGGTAEINLMTLGDFTVDIPADVDWITVDATKAAYRSETVKLIVAANKGSEAREAKVSFKPAKGGEKVFTVSQKVAGVTTFTLNAADVNATDCGLPANKANTIALTETSKWTFDNVGFESVLARTTSDNMDVFYFYKPATMTGTYNQCFIKNTTPLGEITSIVVTLSAAKRGNQFSVTQKVDGAESSVTSDNDATSVTVHTFAFTEGNDGTFRIDASTANDIKIASIAVNYKK